MLEILMEDMKKTLDDFYRITGMQISLYDDKKRSIYHAKKTGDPLCSLYKKHPETSSRCRECEMEGRRICEESKKTHIYRCHAGFMEAYIPLIEDNEMIGYLLTGQILCPDNVEYARAKAEEYEKLCCQEEAVFTKLLEEKAVVKQSYLQSAVNMMEMCASYLYLNQIIYRKPQLLSARLKDYVDSHYTENLSVQSLCDMLYISKAKLYNLSQDAFGMGSSEYILSKRLEKAMNLLAKSEKSIGVVAEESGFQDANYFSRIFKKTVGMSPRQYRKENQ